MRRSMANVAQSNGWRLRLTRIRQCTVRLGLTDIRADRWSCGRVVLYLLDELKIDDERLKVIGRKLKVHDPYQWPSLVKWQSWLPVPGLNIGDIEKKASRPRQDSMVVNEGDTTAPSAKRQRLAALDVTQFPALDESQASPTVVRVH